MDSGSGVGGGPEFAGGSYGGGVGGKIVSRGHQVDLVCRNRVGKGKIWGRYLTA